MRDDTNSFQKQPINDKTRTRNQHIYICNKTLETIVKLCKYNHTCNRKTLDNNTSHTIQPTTTLETPKKLLICVQHNHPETFENNSQHKFRNK